MATSKKHTKFSTKAFKSPKDHLPAADQNIEIDTSEGLLVLPRAKMPAEIMFSGDGELSEVQVMKRLIDVNITDDEQKARLLSLDASGADSEFAEVFEIWQKESGFDMGESSASTD